MKTAIVSASKDNNFEQSLLSVSLNGIKETTKTQFDIFNYPNNSHGLSTVYNNFLEKHGKDYDIAVFVHDDVFIDDANFINKVAEGFDVYDIIGVAGGFNPVIKKPTLWHLMCQRENLRGIAGHFHPGLEQVSYSVYGHVPARVSLLDGLFLAVNIKKINEVGWQFNENFDFHLYDLASCMDANAKKLKMGVLPIYLIHKSPGLRSIEDPVFVKNQEKFLEIYGS